MAMNRLLDVTESGKSTLLKAFSNKTGSLPPNYKGQIFLPKSFVENRDGLKPKPIYLVYVSQKDFFHESKCNFYEICSTKDHSSFSFSKKCSPYESCLKWYLK